MSWDTDGSGVGDMKCLFNNTFIASNRPAVLSTDFTAVSLALLGQVREKGSLPKAELLAEFFGIETFCYKGVCMKAMKARPVGRGEDLSESCLQPISPVIRSV